MLSYARIAIWKFSIGTRDYIHVVVMTSYLLHVTCVLLDTLTLSDGWWIQGGTSERRQITVSRVN